ncbi:MAG: response regulator [Deltaproteobacteria bacterium]|nr:response regulator [Deltaproteobacteria bacterium]
MSQGPQDKRALGRIALQRQVAQRPGVGSSDSTEPDVGALKALSEQHGVPGIDLTQVCIRLTDLDLLPREIAEKHAILPVLVRDDRVFIAMQSPGDRHIIDELEFVTGKKVYPYVALPSELQRVMSSAYDLKNQGEQFYVGPRCPQETLDRMGARERSQDTPPAPPPAPQKAMPREEPAVVVDELKGSAVGWEELSDADFNVSDEVSVVTDLPTDPSAGPMAMAPDKSKKTILVVDDETDIRKMLRRLLTDRGYNVLEAERGLQAMRVVKEQVPDLIILDAMLPEVHGFEIARRIKGSERYGHIPIIMISAVYRGWRYAEDVKTSYGVDAYIEKPFRIADIMKAIDGVMSAPSGKQEESKTSSGAEQALAQGVAAYQAGNLDQAIEHLKRGVGIDPLAYRLHFHLGLLYGKKEQIYEAIQHLETALQINPKQFPAMKNLAVLYQKAGFRNKAIEMWERAIPVAPDDGTRQSIKELLLGLL